MIAAGDAYSPAASSSKQRAVLATLVTLIRDRGSRRSAVGGGCRERRRGALQPLCSLGRGDRGVRGGGGSVRQREAAPSREVWKMVCGSLAAGRRVDGSIGRPKSRGFGMVLVAGFSCQAGRAASKPIRQCFSSGQVVLCVVCIGCIGWEVAGGEEEQQLVAVCNSMPILGLGRVRMAVGWWVLSSAYCLAFPTPTVSRPQPCLCPAKILGVSAIIFTCSDRWLQLPFVIGSFRSGLCFPCLLATNCWSAQQLRFRFGSSASTPIAIQSNSKHVGVKGNGKRYQYILSRAHK